jgi:hypothetical protein
MQCNAMQCNATQIAAKRLRDRSAIASKSPRIAVNRKSATQSPRDGFAIAMQSLQICYVIASKSSTITSGMDVKKYPLHNNKEQHHITSNITTDLPPGKMRL